MYPTPASSFAWLRQVLRSSARAWSGFVSTPGARTFTVVWLGQVVSQLGSGITNFAIGIWIYRHTGSVTQFALALLVGVVPGIILSPVAGVLVDRWDRRVVMLLSTGVSALRTATLLALATAGVLEPWQVYIAGAVGSAAGAFRRPAYDAALPLLVPRTQLTRANGLVGFGQSAGDIAAPLLAGVLMPVVGLRGVLALDLATFGVALATLLAVRFPSQHAGSGRRRRSFWGDAREGWTYIAERPGLLSLLAFFAVLNLGLSFLQALTTPLVLSFASERVLGSIASVGSCGMLLGSLLMTTWKGPRRLVDGVLLSGVGMGVGMIAAGLRPSVPLVAAGLVAVYVIIPIGNACSRTIWQTRVPKGLQGRVFATRAALSWATMPLAYLLAGPLTDQVFEPLVRGQGGRGWVGALLGEGAGRGIGALLVVAGVAILAVSLLGFRAPRLRRVEDEVPEEDAHDAPAPPAAVVA